MAIVAHQDLEEMKSLWQESPQISVVARSRDESS
jgi:hypothetical protein